MLNRCLIFLLAILATPCIAAEPPMKRADAVDPLISSAINAARSGDLKLLANEVRPRAKAAVAEPAALDSTAVLSIATCREFARYFARLEEVSDPNKDLLAWLIAQPKLANTMMMAIAPQDPPDGLLAVLRRLHDDFGDDISKSPDLVAAFCTVWDSTGDINEDAKKVNLDRVSRLYRYYTKSSPRFDLQELPWQLSTWVVSNPLSDEELKWARAKYLDWRSPAEAFFDPPYNEYPGYAQEPNRETGLAYLLPNLARVGGRSADRAYFAAAVSRTLGVPAGVCTATMAGEDQWNAPAWAAVLEVTNRRVWWNHDAARHPEHRGWRGTVIDPQTHGPMLDSELTQLAELQAVSADRRLASVAIWKLLDAAPEANRPDLLLKAIELSPGNLRAWQSLSESAEKRKLSDQQKSGFVTAIEKYAVPRNAAFAFEMYMSTVKPHGTLQQLPLLDRAGKWFANQPEVLARVKLEQGDAHQKLKRPDLAMSAYRDAINLQPRCSPIVLESFQRIDAMLRANNDLPRLLDAYAGAWPRLDRPKQSPYSRSVPYVMIGQLYARALDDAGRTNDASRIRTMIDTVQLNRE